MTLHILATGFSVFPGAPENPTAWAMAEIERTGWQPKGARLSTRTMPVRFDLWEREYAPLMTALQPDAVIAFGLSAKAKGVTLESTARNAVAADRPDHTGMCAAGVCVIDGAPTQLVTGLPIADIERRLTQANIPVDHSDDAGDYLCNLVFYRLMTNAMIGGPQIAGFIHVPYLDTQIARLAAQGHPIEHASTLTESQLLATIQVSVDACVAALSERQRYIA
jgi:pyroglutamyl-peptidase